MPERKVSKRMTAELKGYFVRQYDEYREAVLSGRRKASRLEYHMVKRQDDDLKNLKGWHFDIDKAVAPLIWFAANLKFPSGDKKGKPLKLSTWQVWITMVLFGWVDDKGNRRFSDGYIEIARKNGKSVWAAAILCYLAFAEGETNGNPCFIAATSLDQAGECFERAAGCLMGMAPKVQNSKNNKQIIIGENRITALSAEPKDGKLPHGAIIDEYHQHKSNELINSIASGNVADPNVMILRITTAGTLLNGVCKQEHDKGLKILEGSIQMDRYFFAIYTIDEGDNVDNPVVWEKANPNLGVSVDQGMLQARYDYSKSSAADMVVFKTKNLNVWVNSLKRWANMDVWIDKCCQAFDTSELEGRICYGGLDLSHNSDFSTLTLDFPYEGDVHRQLWWYFIPEGRAIELERILRVPILQWIQDGYIIPTPGPIVDYAYIAKAIEEVRNVYDLKMIAADRWHLAYLDQHMPDWWQTLACEFSQGWKMMSTATSNFERAYLTGRIQSNGNPVQKWMMSCAESRADINGNVKIVKPDVTKSTTRIDGVITSIMAYDTASAQEGLQIDEDNLDSLMRFF